jgi:DNA topoisomerase-1
MDPSSSRRSRGRGAARDAGAAGLRYASDDRPGLRRVRVGRGFRYLRPSGAPVRDRATLERIARLAIPPAYRDVWISPDPRGHLQATGRDARGRKQYRYHARWREVRDETKFDRLLSFGAHLPALRRRVRRDLARRGLPRAKVVAAVLALLEDTCLRVGNEEYAQANSSYGLSTLRDKHVRVKGPRMVFEFRGKLGKRQRCELKDRRLAALVARCQALPGERLFQCIDESGRRSAIGSQDVNDYLRATTGQDFTAKDFRTWAGSLLAAEALRAQVPDARRARRSAQIQACIDSVAARLHNTRAVCSRYYVHPALLESFEAGRLARSLRRGRKGPAGLSQRERALYGFLAGLQARARPRRRR